MLRLALLLIATLGAAFATEYSLCFLTAEPNAKSIDAERGKELQKQHMAHIGTMCFQEKMGQYVALFSMYAPTGKTLVQGSPTHPKWKYFSVLRAQKLDEVPSDGESAKFLWYHDPQVWPVAAAK